MVDLLEEIKEIRAKRQETHGRSDLSMQHIAYMWGAYLKIHIPASDVAFMMQMVKMARTKDGGYNRDDYLDNIGYALIAAECVLDD